MAIKAIINNTEKEIEQIKDSDEQDIDYVYSRIGDTEVEGEPSISIKSIGGNLSNYRIYGNTVDGKSVGDLVESGEHSGEYIVPVKIEGKNLFQNTATSRIIGGLTLTVNTDGSVTCNGRREQTSTFFTIGSVTTSGEIILSGCPSGGSSASFAMRAFSATVSNPRIYYDIGDSCMLNTPDTYNIDIRIQSNYACDNLTFYPMIRKADIEDDTYEPYHAPITTPIYLPEQIRKVGDEAEYIDYGEQKMHRIGADDIDVTLPALSTIKGINTLSVGTSIQPSNIYIKDGFDYKRVFTATRIIEGELPLNYRSIEDNDSTLSNYCIYGNTAGGESVGDRTGNLWDEVVEQGSFNGADGTETVALNNRVRSKNVTLGVGNYTISANGVDAVIVMMYLIDGTYARSESIANFHNLPFSFSLDAERIIRFAFKKNDNSGILPSDISNMMLNSGSTALPYEPYGYRIPVTVSNGTDTLTTPIYLPEQIKKVGDEAEYIDYGEQKQHRVRKNLFDVTAQHTVVYNTCYKYVISGLNPNLNYTCSTNYNQENHTDACVYFCGSLTRENGVWQNEPKTYKPNNDGEIIILIRFIQYHESLPIYDAVVSGDIWIMVNSGPTPLPYEPYIENTELDVTIPALPTLTGTNTLTVGTEVQPSDIYLKGKIKKKPKIYYKIYYYSQDGQTALSTETVEEGHDCTYSTVPTKESDTDFDYTFTGWSTTTNQSSPTSDATTNIQQDTNLYAAFSKSFKTDTISDSWEEIIANCDNGTYASKYQIGDLKAINVGTEGPVQMQIVAIDTDLLASDNTKKAPITWISKQLLNTYKAMHSTSSNYLSDWANCDMRTYLRGTILPMLPSAVQNGIKEVTKYTCKRTSSTTWTTVSATENIWLPSYREVSNNTLFCETSGVQYNSIFTNDRASRVKSKVGNSADHWWTRSASGYQNSDYSYCFAYVYNGGYAHYTGRHCTGSYGVAIGFCT